jgi:hypothetical protein
MTDESFQDQHVEGAGWNFISIAACGSHKDNLCYSTRHRKRDDQRDGETNRNWELLVLYTPISISFEKG